MSTRAQAGGGGGIEDELAAHAGGESTSSREEHYYSDPSSSFNPHPTGQPSLSSSSQFQTNYSPNFSSRTFNTSSTTLPLSTSPTNTSNIPATSVTPSSPNPPQGQGGGRGSTPTGGESQSVRARPSLEDHRRASSNASITTGSYSNGVGLGGGQQPGRASLSSPTMEDGMAREGVPVLFDEGVLRQLCDLDCAMPLLDSRIKQSLASCKQISLFLKMRAKVEETYARSLGEAGRDLMDQYARSEGKAGTFIKAYQDSLKTNDQIAQQRLRFATRLNEMGDELASLGKEMEKARKQHKETGSRYERSLQDADGAMEKAKSRFDTTVEELERILILKEGGNVKDATMQNGPPANGSSDGKSKKLGKAFGKGAGGLFKNKNPVQMQKQEDETRLRMSQTSDAFRKAVLESQSVRQEYFNSQLPKVLRLLKQCADEIDMATQYHLSRYAFLYESQLVQEGSSLAPMDPPEGTLGLKAIVDSIDSRTDFKTFMQNFVVANAKANVSRAPRREGLYEEGYQPPLPPHVQNSQTQMSGAAPSPNGNQVFGYDLTEAMLRDGDEVPRVLEMCAEAIEARGLTSMGIYRLSGMTSAVQKLKAAFDRDVGSVDLEDDAYADINVIASTLKLWFRELPDPLFTYNQFGAFMEAARLDNDRLRHIRLHEQINELPDANYAALKYFMAHLHKVRDQEKINQMSASNLAIVFGPTLFRQPPEGGGPEGLSLQDLMSFQCRAVETILLKYEEIFV